MHLRKNMLTICRPALHVLLEVNTLPITYGFIVCTVFSTQITDYN